MTGPTEETGERMGVHYHRLMRHPETGRFHELLLIERLDLDDDLEHLFGHPATVVLLQRFGVESECSIPGEGRLKREEGSLQRLLATAKAEARRLHAQAGYEQLAMARAVGMDWHRYYAMEDVARGRALKAVLTTPGRHAVQMFG